MNEKQLPEDFRLVVIPDGAVFESLPDFFEDEPTFTAEQMRAQYSAGFRDGRASAMALDPQAPVIAGSS